MSGKIERPRGTHDVVPAEMPLWQRVTGEVERLCALYGYRKILTPVFEDTALFARTSGQGSDVVQKEMYSFTDRSDRPLTLRPEGTAPICRAYVEHGMHRDPQPVKMFTIAPDVPLRRARQGPLPRALAGLGRGDRHRRPVDRRRAPPALRHAARTASASSAYHLELNSIGCRTCRPAYLETLRAWLAANEHRLDADTRAKVATSPLRVFDNYLAKPEAVRAALDEAPKIGESLCEECVAHFAAVRADLDATGVAYTLVPTLVRGLDYYTRTTWEFIGPMDNENSTISGGGRYDGLVEEIGGPPTPGVGFGAGLERLLLAMEDAGATADAPTIDVFFALEDGAPRQHVARWLAELRRLGVAADTDYAGRSLKGQLTQAARLGAAATVVVGRDEAVLRGPGQADEPLAHADIVGRLSA